MSLAMLLLALAALIPTGIRPSERWPELERAGARLGRGAGVGIGRRSGTAAGRRSGAEAWAHDPDTRSELGREWAAASRGPEWTRFLRDRVGGRSRAPDPIRLLDAASSLDLLAACLGAGMPPGEAASATASAASPGLAGPLHDVSMRLALGVAAPWKVLDNVPEMADIVALARRSGDSGAAMSMGVAELAAARRAEAGDGAEATAERAGVLIAGPLALCFLPAFVVLGLIPTIAGLAESMLGPLTAGPT